jgi:hypothetical protein
MLTRSFVLPALLAISGATAQDHAHTDRCKAHTITEKHLIEQGLPSDIAQALPRVALADASRGGTYTIPVVFHVVWNTNAENIPASAINAVMNQLNQDYSASNSNIGGVRSTFTNSIGNVGFQFCLAQFDPQGNATTGITRTQTSVTWFDPDTQTNDMKEPPSGKSAWDPTRYLNVWVCDISSGASGGLVTLGYAYLPTPGVVGTSIDGLVVDYQYGMALSSRTSTHEIGHYFGLQHPWGNGNGSCGVDDGFTDTPNTDSPTFSCSNTNLQKCGVLTQYENFMDYANCSAMFTDQQANYMAGILTGIRSSLLASTGCSIVPTGPCIPTSANGTADGDFINGVQLGIINNQNSGGTTQPTYTNFSSTYSTSLVRGNTYTITIQSGTYSPNRYAAWIDYDQNGTFVLSEKLGEFTSAAAGETQSLTFTVPAGSAVGATRLRVRGVFVGNGEPSPADPCFAYAYGETEDYGITITTPPTGYCVPTSTNGTNDGDYINGVTLGNITNTNSGGAGQPTYSNVSSTWSTGLVRGSAQTITIQGGSYSPDHYAAWIDYDQNNVFAANEKLGEFTTSASGQTQNISFTVPVSANLGTTRLRVRGVFHNQGEPAPTDPCFNYAWGETEDYSVVIQLSTGMDDARIIPMALYPNPARGSVVLERGSSGPAEVEIRDMQGRLVATHRINDAVVTLSLTDHADGHYVMRVLQEEDSAVMRLEIIGGWH